MSRNDTIVVFEDIHPTFIKLAKRLQQLAGYSAKGLSIITLSVLLFDGEPVQYTRPDVSNMATLEPHGNSDEFCRKLREVR